MAQLSFAQAQLDNRVKPQSALSKAHALIDWERLRPLCDGLHARDASPECKGGQGPFDGLMMFKALLLGQWLSLLDPK